MKSLESIKRRRLDIENALIPSDSIYSGVLTSSEQTVSVPSGAEYVIFNATGDFYANYDTTAAIPTGSISNAGGELNPIVRYIGEVSVIHLISPITINITLSFYSK